MPMTNQGGSEVSALLVILGALDRYLLLGRFL